MGCHLSYNSSWWVVCCESSHYIIKTLLPLYSALSQRIAMEDLAKMTCREAGYNKDQTKSPPALNCYFSSARFHHNRLCWCQLRSKAPRLGVKQSLYLFSFLIKKYYSWEQLFRSCWSFWGVFLRRVIVRCWILWKRMTNIDS